MSTAPTTKKALLSEIHCRLGRHNFWYFCLFMDVEFFTIREFLQEVADAFQWLYEEYLDGRDRKVSVSMPPRAGKSYITSLFCAWWLGKNPTKAIMRNTCTARLYDKFSRDVRAIIQSDKFKKVFPHVELHPTNQAVEGWSLTTSVQRAYFGAGVNGTIIGFGANLAITDDLYKDFENAASENTNETVHSWKQSAHNSRFEGVCPEIFIGTRWLTRDVIGTAIAKGQIDKVVKIAALNEKNESFCPAVRTTAQYLKTKAETDAVVWDAEYMQEPGDVAGMLFPKSELRFYNPKTITFEAEHKLIYIDPADEGGDDLAAPVGYLVGDRIYVPWVMYNNHGTDVNEQACADLIANEKAHAVRVEGNSAWILFAKAVRKRVHEKHEDCDFRVIKNTTHKGTRILAQAQWVKNRFIFREDYEDFPEYSKFIKILTGYLRNGGDNQKDDAPDALTGMAEYYRTTFRDVF